jgi:hypothetical protein
MRRGLCASAHMSPQRLQGGPRQRGPAMRSPWTWRIPLSIEHSDSVAATGSWRMRYRGSRGRPHSGPVARYPMACCLHRPPSWRTHPDPSSTTAIHTPPHSQRHAPGPLAATGLASPSAASAQLRCGDRCATRPSSRPANSAPSLGSPPISAFFRPRDLSSLRCCARRRPPAPRRGLAALLRHCTIAPALRFPPVARPCEHQTR